MNLTKSGYPRHCSCRCTQLDKNVRGKNADTCLKKYGTKNAAQSDKVQSKMKATCLERYGAENAFASEIIKQRIKEDNIRKYGVANAAQRPDIIKKRKATCIKKYGYPDPRPTGIHNVSKGELELIEECRKIYNGTIIANDRKVIWPMEIDVWFPDLKFGIEYDGDYWHSIPKMQERDKIKDSKCDELGILLIRVKESDFLNNKEVILKNINEILNKRISKK